MPPTALLPCWLICPPAHAYQAVHAAPHSLMASYPPRTLRIAHVPQKYVFYAALSPLIAFYIAFTALLYPLHGSLHLNGFYATTAALVPQGLHGLLKGGLVAGGGRRLGRVRRRQRRSCCSRYVQPAPTLLPSHPHPAVIEYWTFSLFYCASELWGSVVISVLFWSLANEVCTVGEAKVQPGTWCGGVCRWVGQAPGFFGVLNPGQRGLHRGGGQATR